jgi:hypothetical protein
LSFDGLYSQFKQLTYRFGEVTSKVTGYPATSHLPGLEQLGPLFENHCFQDQQPRVVHGLQIGYLWASNSLLSAVMMRNKTASSFQKTYDDCYLICATAVYYEGQVRFPIVDANYQAPEKIYDRIESPADGIVPHCRGMKPKPYDHGDQPWTRFTTTMPIGFLQGIDSKGQSQRSGNAV